MIEPLQLAWIAFIIFLFLLLLVLLEIHRINYRRDNEVMFGTETFDEKVKEIAFTDKERRTLEKIIRTSSFENKDAVLNSSGLFEAAVSRFYDFRNVFSVRDETVDAVERIREKLGFTAVNPLTQICSSRQFGIGDRIDLILDDGRTFKHSEIIHRSEKEWFIAYAGSRGSALSFVGKEVGIKWTRPNDAVYSARLKVRSCLPGQLILPHTTNLEKRQFRRWVREQVSIPVVATLPDVSTCGGMLFDLSAGGFMFGLPLECRSGLHMNIKFELPSFGEENVEIEILRNLGHKNSEFPSYFCLTAEFVGEFGWTQERVLQYIFEVNKGKNRSKKA